MEITYRKVDDLIFYEHNAKLHPDSQVKKLAYIIEQVGFRDPVLVDGDGVIVAGHGRVLAAKRAGLSEVPSLDASDMSPDQVKAYRIAANKVADTGYNEELLAVDLQELSELEADLKLTGLGEQEIDGLLDDPEVIIDPEAQASNSGGHSPTPTISFWIFDYKVTDGRDEIWQFVKENLDKIRKMEQSRVVDAIVGGLHEILD